METEEHHRIAVDYGNYENILNGFELETNIIDYNGDKFPIIKKIGNNI